jgi:hypothetical protein
MTSPSYQKILPLPASCARFTEKSFDGKRAKLARSLSQYGAMDEKKFLLGRKHRWTLISLLLVVPIGFYSKFYAGPAAFWVNNSLGGVWYEIFWCLVACLSFDQGKPWLIATVVLMATCTLEFLQLWHPPMLEYLRGFFIGRTVLGTSFAWSDFPYYVAGCGIGWLWIRCLQAGEARTTARQPIARARFTSWRRD